MFVIRSGESGTRELETRHLCHTSTSMTGRVAVIQLVSHLSILPEGVRMISRPDRPIQTRFSGVELVVLCRVLRLYADRSPFHIAET